MNAAPGCRAFVVVIDALGVGALPDAADYGDEGANTLAHLARAAGGLRLPTLERLGLGSILAARGVAVAERPAVHGRLAAQGAGKDSQAGHRELLGVVANESPPTYPDGFPDEVVAVVEREAGRPVVGNGPFDGLAAIAALGERALADGALILYTSQDSVLQLAAHVDRVEEAELHAICARVRDALPREHAVGRVIARPFAGAPGAFARTAGRKDLALEPPTASVAERLQGAGVPTISVGKVRDLFAGRGFDHVHPGADNAQAIGSLDALVHVLERGFVMANLVDTDQLFGHRKDVEGFASALGTIDAAVARWERALRPGDLLVVTADHGVDPAMAHSDHTREHVPLLALALPRDGSPPPSHRHDGAMADVGQTVHRWLAGRLADGLPGRDALAAA